VRPTLTIAAVLSAVLSLAIFASVLCPYTVCRGLRLSRSRTFITWQPSNLTAKQVSQGPIAIVFQVRLEPLGSLSALDVAGVRVVALDVSHVATLPPCLVLPVWALGRRKRMGEGFEVHHVT
jgi:hypothetical protein